MCFIFHTKLFSSSFFRLLYFSRPLPIHQGRWHSLPSGNFPVRLTSIFWNCKRHNYLIKLPQETRLSVSKKVMLSASEFSLNYGWILIEICACKIDTSAYFTKIKPLTCPNWVIYWPRREYLKTVAIIHQEKSTQISTKPCFDRRWRPHLPCTIPRLH